MGSLVVGLARDGRADRDVAKRMLRSAPHRGEERQVVALGDVVLGISRHPELGDASLARDDGFVAAVAGVIDNREELNRELTRGGVPVGGEGAAHTVLAAFRAWGDDAPGRLRGGLAGAISDGRDLRCFRDHLGSQTLYFQDGETAFLAASEAKQVVAGAGGSREPDVEAVTDILFQRLDERRTAIKGVERLQRATIATVRHSRGVAPRRYWDPRPLIETARLSVPDACEGLAELLDQAVRRALTGNDAVSLSGGIDSPAVAAFAAPRHLELSGRPLTAVSSVYPDYPSVDETYYIDLVARRLDLDLHTYVQRATPLDDLTFWVDVLDGPWEVLSVQGLAETYRLARELGARRILTGEMAEDVATVGGPLFGHLIFARRLGPALEWVRRSRARGRTRQVIAREMLTSLTPVIAATAYMRLRRARLLARKAARLPAWIDPAAVSGLGVMTDYTQPIGKRWLEWQASPALAAVGPSMEAEDLCAARLGVELRLPFADVDLWEFFLSLPAEVKFPDLNHASKRLIRDAMRGRVPDEILDRMRKTFFNDHIAGTADYPRLRRLVLDREVRVEGVDYRLLGERLDRGDLSVNELIWAYDLARVHAFLGLFE
jgi:asparagine synthase (glutamine-hydrolysing)